jgi:hypothetical protein
MGGLVFNRSLLFQHYVVDEVQDRFRWLTFLDRATQRPVANGARRGPCLSSLGHFRSVDAVKGDRREPRSRLDP